jgi:hypothetical protein
MRATMICNFVVFGVPSIALQMINVKALCKYCVVDFTSIICCKLGLPWYVFDNVPSFYVSCLFSFQEFKKQKSREKGNFVSQQY